MRRRVAVVAVGGNSIIKSGEQGTRKEQFRNISDTAFHIASLSFLGYDLVITHGNGPQVGNALLRVKATDGVLPPLLLDSCGAQTQGELGYMLQQVLGNGLRKGGINKSVATVITQVVVDRDDPAFANPTKPIGPFYTAEEKEKYEKLGWVMIEDAGRGYRRVVPSPFPKEIVESDIIKRLIYSGYIVIGVGGGGIPVVKNSKGELEGVKAVIDKDFASSLLATSIDADLFLISTDVEKVFLNYNTSEQEPLNSVKLADMKNYLVLGHFAEGSMKPKIEAAIHFLEHGGREVIITSPQSIEKALRGETGTKIVGD